jgi:UDP:flavonoid glycosyltransferase YjiC (YdhE family)
MRVLMISTPSATHMMPIVPLAWGLRAAGHEVLVLGQPDIVPTARGAGLPAVSIGDMFDGMELTHALPPGVRPIEAGLFQVADGQWPQMARTWVIHAKYMIGRYLEFARAWSPDLLLTDPLEYAALIMGGVLGIPVVQHRWGPEPLSHAGVGLAQKVLHGRAVMLGAPDGVPAPTVVLDPYPPGWNVPGVPGGTRIRPVPYNGGGSRPDWARTRRAARRVVVSLGSMVLDLNGLPLVRYLAEAAALAGDMELLVTVPDRYRAELGPLPEAVTLVPPTPLHLFISDCDAVVHHGGGGTALTALAHGIPQLMLPQMVDQFVRCERIAASGVGLTLPDAAVQNSPQALAGALAEVLEKPAYAEAAAALSEESARLPSPAQVAADLAELAGDGRS